jgi:hypothetical protein
VSPFQELSLSSEKKQEAVEVDREVRDLVRKIETTWLSLGRLCERCRREADSRTAAIEAIFAEYDVGHADPEKELEAERQGVS